MNSVTGMVRSLHERMVLNCVSLVSILQSALF